MSIVIVGGNERMVCLYEDICKNHGCSAKVFVKEKGALKKKIGCPDLLILFTNTVSHRMVNDAVEEAKRNNIPIERLDENMFDPLRGDPRFEEVRRRLGENATPPDSYYEELTQRFSRKITENVYTGNAGDDS